MLKVYNTLNGKKEEFKVDSSRITMYVCGPTVYDLSHLGHARSAVAFDVIYRYLKYKFKDSKVIYTRNYTDIDDKIINRANREGVSSQEIAERYIEAFNEDMKALGVEIPTYRPKATETIPDMIKIIQTLIENGYAYTIDGDVYYSVRKFEGYGRLSGKNVEELEAGARVEVDERKNDPLDFALWKASKQGEPAWPSPWGPGRPGWHIECSAMSQKFLGETIDIHGGGKDLIFPHHENEIAQSESATGQPFARYWFHNGFVNIEKEKMSKSLGNILAIRDILKAYPAEAVRLFLLSSHYRSPIDYSSSALRDAESALERFYKTVERMDKEWPDIKHVNEERKKERIQPVINAMDDDFNTAVAIARLRDEVNTANREMDRATKYGIDAEFQEVLPIIRAIFQDIGNILGIFHRRPDEYFKEKQRHLQISPEEIEKLKSERNDARMQEKWEKADAIRRYLEERGIILEDYPGGTRWKVR